MYRLSWSLGASTSWNPQSLPRSVMGLLYLLPCSTALVDLGFLFVEVSRSHSDTPHSVGLLWTRDRPVAETSTWQHTTHTTHRHPCHPAVFEPAISASERSQTHNLDCPATGIDVLLGYLFYFILFFVGFSLTSGQTSLKDFGCYKQFIRYVHIGCNLVPFGLGRRVL